MIDYTIACRLRDALLEHPAFSDFHSISPAAHAIEAVQQAGLATALIPLAATTRKAKYPTYEMHLAVVDPQPDGHLYLNTEKGEAPSKVYSLTRLLPMTNYLQDLVSADLSRLWWSAPTFFYDSTRALVDFTTDHDGGMSSWGARDRQAFRVAFDAEWTPDHAPVAPKVPIPPMKVRFSSIPALVAPTIARELSCQA